MQPGAPRGSLVTWLEFTPMPCSPWQMLPPSATEERMTSGCVSSWARKLSWSALVLQFWWNSVQDTNLSNYSGFTAITLFLSFHYLYAYFMLLLLPTAFLAPNGWFQVHVAHLFSFRLNRVTYLQSAVFKKFTELEYNTFMPVVKNS